MASEGKAEQRHRSPTAVITAGCENHSIDQVRHGLRLAAESSPETYSRVLNRALSTAMLNGAADLALYLVTEEHAPLDIEPCMLSVCQSLPLWSAMIERGWDINQRAPWGRLNQQQRLLDLICGNEDLVRWCLDHGARVDNDYDRVVEPGKMERIRYPPLLESAAEWGTVSTFELLRGLGAATGPRMLHLAVGRAASDKNNRAMEMVRYLVDEVGIDVNQQDSDVLLPMHLGPPINYAVKDSRTGGRVVRFLLERGADPYRKPVWGGGNVFELAELYKNQEVLGILQEWKDGEIPIKSRIQ